MRPAVLIGRLKEMASQCRTRGGTCDCAGECQTVTALSLELIKASRAERDATDRREAVERQIKRMSSPIATLRRDALAACPQGYRPVMVFDGEDAIFGFENDDDDRIESDWPFEEEYVWFDDCTRNGIEVIQA